MADALPETCLAALWASGLKHDAADPHWPDRDRLVRAHHGADLAEALGMALVERLLAARFGRSLVDHRTWVLADPAALEDGAAHEAICMAGLLQLDRLAVLCAGPASPMTQRQFAAGGWAVKPATEHGQIVPALQAAQRGRKPMLIVADLPAGTDKTDAELGTEAGGRGARTRRAWLKRLARHPLRLEFDRVQRGRPPDASPATGTINPSNKPTAGIRQASPGVTPSGTPLGAVMAVLDNLSAAVPELALAQADSPLAHGPTAQSARTIDFGVRRLALAGAMAGMAAHGGVLPCAGAQVDAAPLLQTAWHGAPRRTICWLHETPPDGHGACWTGLRATPDLWLLRPGNATEARDCLNLALRRSEGPSLLLLHDIEFAASKAVLMPNRCGQGGYVMAEAAGHRRATLIASGMELHAALLARDSLAGAGIAAAVVSMPCWALFSAQDRAYRDRVLGRAPRFGIEVSTGFGWTRWLGTGGIFIPAIGEAALTKPGKTGQSEQKLARHIVQTVRQHLEREQER